VRFRRLILFLLALKVASAASFDCVKARTPQEKAICASPELGAIDDKMAASYRTLLSQVPSDLASGIRDSQRDWIRSMSTACPATPYYPSAPEITMCLENYENDRFAALEHMVLHQNGVTFVWRSITLTASATTPPADESRPDGAGTLSASWPQAATMNPAWVAWNKALEAAVRTMAAASDAPSDGKWHADWASDEDIDIATSVDLVRDNLVTATIDDNWYGHGAAHPNEASMQFNWLLKERRELKPEDVFRAGSNWVKILLAFCDKDLHQKLDADLGQSYELFSPPGEMQKTLQSIVTKPANWRLDSSGITVIWQKYAVACYACTPEPTNIPWNTLKPYLNSTFVVPRNELTAHQ
jgi:uncharacterized protein YecT (DUF1311 family)